LLDAATVPATTRAARLAQLRLLTSMGKAAPALDDDDIQGWLTLGREAGWLHADSGLDEAERVLAVWLGLARAVHTYRCAPPYCPVILVIAADAERADRTLGWDMAPSWRVVTSPGDHMSMVSAAHAPSLARALSSCLLSPHSLKESS
jgi:thioesterase domain-containing protein